LNLTVTTQTTIERKQYSDQRAATVMLSALRGRGAKLTRADAIAASGLPEDEAGRALTALLKDYRSHLSATESGEVLYDFDPTFTRRDAVPWRERAAAVAGVAWRAFSFLFKIAIVTTLIGYFAVFVAMMLAMIFARSSSDRDDDRGGGFGIGPLFWFWGWDAGAGHDAYGRRIARAAPAAPRVPFYKRVFAFVFGPAGVQGRSARGREADRQPHPRPARAHRAGRSRSSDGLELPARRGGGHAADGRLRRRARGHRRRRGRLRVQGPAQDRDGADCRGRAGVGIATARADAAVDRQRAGHERAHRHLQRLQPAGAVLDRPGVRGAAAVSLASWHAVFYSFPIAFSALFFAVPFGRWIKGRVAERSRRARNDRRRLLGRIFAGTDARRGPVAREEVAPTPELGAVLDRELVSLGGDVAPNPTPADACVTPSRASSRRPRRWPACAPPPPPPSATPAR
jgi:hypothetical protein